MSENETCVRMKASSCIAYGRHRSTLIAVTISWKRTGMENVVTFCTFHETTLAGITHTTRRGLRRINQSLPNDHLLYAARAEFAGRYARRKVAIQHVYWDTS